MLCPTCKSDDCVESVQCDNCTACGWAQQTPLEPSPTPAPMDEIQGVMKKYDTPETTAPTHECICGNNYFSGIKCPCLCEKCNPLSPDKAVEDQIKLMEDLFGGQGRQNLGKHCRRLVSLVRQERKSE
jgi:hypothetical protein